MPRHTVRVVRLFGLIVLFGGMICGGGFAAASQHSIAVGSAQTYIVQATTTAQAEAMVHRAHGQVVRRLSIINGVSALLTPAALAQLRATSQIVLHADAPVQVSGKGAEPSQTAGKYLYPAAATGAYQVHTQNVRGPKTTCKDRRVQIGTTQEDRDLRGWGVTVAVIDSGFMQMQDPKSWKYQGSDGTLYTENGGRCLAYRDFLPRTAANDNLPNKDGKLNSTDQHGHGTHVTATIGDNRATPLATGANATPVGVAPQVNLLVARALDANGAGTYGDVIAAIDWVVQNKAAYNVRILNLSLYSPVTGPYWADPMNQAVMKAWQSGIVVVAAAGNDGPTAGTITAPGNVPYVITVGAIKSGRYTASGYDELASYSSRGPTESAFVKPDVLVPGSRTIAPMPTGSTLAQQVEAGRIQEKAQVDFKIGAPTKEHTYYQLSGTSMAAAQVSGIAALLLQANPGLTNDQVKYRLMATAQQSLEAATNTPTYTVWEQGAGLVNIQQALASTTTERANGGMDIGLDLASTTHYWGNTTWNEATGQFEVINTDTGDLQVWDGASRVWSGASRVWSGGSRVWSGGSRVWSGASRVWSGGTTTWAGSDSFWAGASRVWSGSTPATSLNSASYTELLVND